jgi:hypothetical protein
MVAVLSLGFLVAGLAGADTVVLDGGALVSGDVKAGSNYVTVTSPSGVLRVPAWRVVRIERAGEGAAEAAEAPAEPEAAQPAAAAQGEGPAAPAAARTTAPAAAQPTAPRRAAAAVRRPPLVADVLAEKVSVDFEGTSLADVLVYIRELTGVNMAIHRDVLLDATPVHITADDISVKVLLDLAFEDRTSGYAALPGNVLYFYGAGGRQVTSMRVYPVGDLLVSTEDRTAGATGAGLTGTGGRGGLQGGGTGGTGGRTGGRAGGGGIQFQVAPQFGISQGQGTVTRGGVQAGRVGGQAGRGGQGRSGLAPRAENLILLIKNTCHRDTWADPYDPGYIDSGG